MSVAKTHALSKDGRELGNMLIQMTRRTFLAQLSPIWLGEGILYVPLDLVVAPLHY